MADHIGGPSMTRALPFTQASIRRAILAAQKAGLCVIGIKSDGTVLTGDNPAALVPAGSGRQDDAEPSKWADVQA